jgi:hypothetical protein
MAKARPAGDRESGFTPETRANLDAFVDALVADGKTEATARSYRSYMVTALLAMDKGQTWEDLTSDVRSAVRAYARLVQG